MEFFILLIFISFISFIAGIIVAIEHEDSAKQPAPTSDSNIFINLNIEHSKSIEDSQRDIIGVDYLLCEYNNEAGVRPSKAIGVKRYNQIGMTDEQKE